MAPVYVNLSKYVSNSAGILGGGATDLTTNQMNNGWQVALPPNLTAMADLPGYCQFAMSSLEEDEVAAIFKRAGEEALLFKPTGTTWGMETTDIGVGPPAANTRRGDLNTPNGYGHYCILVFVDGYTLSSGAAPANTPILELEVRSHYECQANPASTALIGAGTAVNIANFDAMKSAPHQPLLMAAADNLASDVPAIRLVDAAGVEESGFISTVVGAWKNACSIATSVAGAVDVVGPLLAALVL